MSPLAVRECVPGEGQLLGGMFLESALGAFLREQLTSNLDGADVREADLENAIQKATKTIYSNAWNVLMDDNWTFRLGIRVAADAPGPSIILAGYVCFPS